MNINKQKGFTLVEIAIVLVIIGLLLGGILKGQELINSARVRNMADQSSGIQAAYYGFIDRYRQVPGDMLGATACTVVGAAVDTVTPCPAGIIGGVAGSNGQNGRIDKWGEAGAVWTHMAVSGFLSGTFTGITTTAALYEGGTVTTPPAVPANAFQNAVLLGFTDDYDNGLAANGTVRLAYSFGAAPASILRELDVKLDDSLPSTGVVRSSLSEAVASAGEGGGSDDFGTGTAGFQVVTWETAAGTTCVTNPDAANATWNVDSDSTRCNALFLY
ncbi:MAG: prepilin-type N-terminal cleavage/methylation domain-containing protein [Gammaproteobacteria bacterium]|jgi:prepilin-type N-terminal cleavage/methylation domain-containing protein